MANLDRGIDARTRDRVLQGDWPSIQLDSILQLMNAKSITTETSVPFSHWFDEKQPLGKDRSMGAHFNYLSSGMLTATLPHDIDASNVDLFIIEKRNDGTKKVHEMQARPRMPYSFKFDMNKIKFNINDISKSDITSPRLFLVAVPKVGKVN